MSASVKVMLSYDYCHFEIQKGTDQPVTDAEIDAMRKDCMRLADKAIAQYKTAKVAAEAREHRQFQFESASRNIERILKVPESERTEVMKAQLKAYRDRNWQAYIDSKRYDYEDDWKDYDDDDAQDE